MRIVARMMEQEETMDVDADSSNRRERAYKCQRCLNHNRVVCRKGHRCPYKDCDCPGCDLNNLRSKFMTLLRERGLNHSDLIMTKKSGRKQHCMLCSFHGERVELRGHKRKCSWANCQCSLCVIGRHYRDTMAKQTKHRRSQRKPGLVESATSDQKDPGTDPGPGPETGSSKRVAMKKDWYRRIGSSQTRNTSSPRYSMETSDGTDVDVGSEGGDSIDQTGPASNADTDGTVWNGGMTLDQDTLAHHKHSTVFHSQQLPLVNVAPAVSSDLCGSFLHHQHSPIVCRPYHPASVNMAALVSALQQQHAADLATAAFISRLLAPSGVLPMTRFCMNCQHQQTPVHANSIWGNSGIRMGFPPSALVHSLSANTWPTPDPITLLQ